LPAVRVLPAVWVVPAIRAVPAVWVVPAIRVMPAVTQFRMPYLADFYLKP
jgi:hypothetical protein